MKQVNAYIEIEYVNNSEGQAEAICHYHPPVEGGSLLDYREALEYVNNNGITNFDNKVLYTLIEDNLETSANLGPADGIDFSESMSIDISLDRMKATARFYPPSKNGNPMDVKDIMTTLNKKGVNYGIDQDVILEFVNSRVYFTDFILATGVAPVHGLDDKIEYFFNTNPNTKPKHNEDGSVDYHCLDNVCAINEGDLLAKLHKGDRGSNGRDVCGKEMPCRTTKILKLDKGKNMHLSEDKTELYSDVTGHVNIINGIIFVSDVYEVDGDVDPSVGNIEYNGNVHIRGSVRGGYSVIAKGDVIVDGVVEDALIQAEGQIIVKCGIHGMRKGILDATGNIVCKFIENASVFSGGYVETGMITYSDVSASDDVIVNESKGFITGGIIRAGGKVDATTIGSSMGASTSIEVGMAPEKKERYVSLQKEIAQITQNINKLNPIMKTYNTYIQQGKQLDQKNALYLQKIAAELKKSTELLAADQEEYNKLHQELITSRHAKVVIRKDIHPGVNLTISDVVYHVKEKRSFCQFEKKNGEVVITTL